MIKNYVATLTSELFNLLQNNETVALSFHFEDSHFIRFNQSKVRQNTYIRQNEMAITFQKNLKEMNTVILLTLDFAQDLKKYQQVLTDFRKNIDRIDISPKFTAVKNNGHSELIKKVLRPDLEQILPWILNHFKNVDMAGFWCAGPVIKISVNSLGQFHYFEMDNFFFDYSVFDGDRASKGTYSAQTWDETHFNKNIQRTISKLQNLNKPRIQIKKGQYRSFLEPMAVAELLGTINWGGFSQAAYQQGNCGLKKLKNGDETLSSLLNLNENLSLGFSPAFNESGEIAPSILNVIKNGQLIELATSTASANEYHTESNFAESHESLRSLEVQPGRLSQEKSLETLGTGLYLSNLHYVNWSDLQNARLTGMTRYACYWVENSEIVGPIEDMRFDDSVYNLFGKNLSALTIEQELYPSTMTYQKRQLGATKVPGALIEDFNFTL